MALLPGMQGAGNVPAREPGGFLEYIRGKKEFLDKLPRKSTGLVKRLPCLAQGRKPRLVYNLAVRRRDFRALCWQRPGCSTE